VRSFGHAFGPGDHDPYPAGGRVVAVEAASERTKEDDVLASWPSWIDGQWHGSIGAKTMAELRKVGCRKLGNATFSLE